ncbi:hypothetical protein TNCV_3935931 [Trichonephila clavipes]|nr:hypothetical protein TNCV_3935931 [Trichonephila clavipes]
MLRRNHLDDFTCERKIVKLEERRSLTSAAEEFGMNKSVVLRTSKAFQTTGTVVRKISNGLPRKITTVDDKYFVL